MHNKSPPLHRNKPPLAGALAWCKALLERASLPIGCLRNLSAIDESSQSGDIDEIEHMYDVLVQQLGVFEKSKIIQWQTEIDGTSQKNLEKHLLQRNVRSLLFVNFDPAIVRLLREAKYFLLLGLEIPDAAKHIYQKADLYRQQIGNLQLIVNMYNTMLTTLLSVEKPLVQAAVDNIDKTIEPGIQELNWINKSVPDFIETTMSTTQSVHKVVTTMKTNLKLIRKMLSEFSIIPLFERKGKPQSPQDMDENVIKLQKTRFSELETINSKISRLVQDIAEGIHISKGDPVWIAYIHYV
eukprot:858271_1